MAEKELVGLTSAEAGSALDQYGPNALPEARPETFLSRLLRQFHNPVIYILLFALVFDLVVWWREGAGDTPLEAITILFILLFNAFLGVWQEGKSEAALARLKALAAPHSWVKRDGELRQIPSAELVPGDLVRIEAGERIPADGRLDAASSFSVDESVLTGESVPLEKSVSEPVLSGTLAVRGLAWLRVEATGLHSNMGKLAQLLQNVEREKTPLEKRLDHFGRQVAIAVIVLALAVLAAGLLSRGLQDFSTLLLFAVALAVAAVPESLPAVLTLAMALGMERMAGRKAVVRKLTAVEALGSVTVIATDKTGTLTENRMRVESLESDQPEQALLAMVLANDADSVTRAGDPLELGLLDFAVEQGLDIEALLQRHVRIADKPFDAAWKYMSVTVQTESATVRYLKGAPEVILGLCELPAGEVSQVQDAIERHASRGYRMLALARGGEQEQSALEWLGLVLLWDPPREEVRGAIAQAQAAGVRVLMITGDHPATARAIADRVGIQARMVMTGSDLEHMAQDVLRQSLGECNVFARVRPEHKLAIVEALQENGEVVAMTGDGVNDAPALKAADVGVAMGQRGSDVSREVADLILLDDNFATIVHAIEEGRSIYENIQKFVRTLFSTNVTEVMLIVVGAMLAFWMTGSGGELLLPFTPAQILWVNLLTDSLPALAITMDRNPGVLTQPPRDPRQPLLDASTMSFVLLVGVTGGLFALALYLLMPRWGVSAGETQTTVFCFLVFVQMLFVLPARRVNMMAAFNLWVLGALAVGGGAQVLTLVYPELGRFLSVHALSLQAWILMLGTLAISWCLAETVALLLRRRHNAGGFATPG